MGERDSPRSHGDGFRLLGQLQLILDHDPLIDELGFVHPSQFATLPAPAKLVDYDEAAFWYNDHKLAISTEILSRLYKAAMDEFLDIRRSFKGLSNGSARIDEILIHTKALLILSSDFTSAWNLRKLVLLKIGGLELFLDEFQLSTLILSYSPKSENAWSHRRWLIKTLAERSQSLQNIVGRESELVKKIAERSKMNYRAWKHRCWLTFYMTPEQVFDELDTSRKWAELNVADNCCFHYRRQLLFSILDSNFVKHDCEASLKHKPEAHSLWKDELQWNELLIRRYIGREALWIHRRFLFQYWIEHFTCIEQVNTCNEDNIEVSPVVDSFLAGEVELALQCLRVSNNEYEDTHLQASHAASYLLWISKKILKSLYGFLEERLKDEGSLKAVLVRTCPEKAPLWEGLLH